MDGWAIRLEYPIMYWAFPNQALSFFANHVLSIISKIWNQLKCALHETMGHNVVRFRIRVTQKQWPLPRRVRTIPNFKKNVVQQNRTSPRQKVSHCKGSGREWTTTGRKEKPFPGAAADGDPLTPKHHKWRPWTARNFAEVHRNITNGARGPLGIPRKCTETSPMASMDR